MSGLIDQDAGRVLVKVVCDGCGAKVVAVLQERDRDDPHSQRLGLYVGKSPEYSGTLVGGRPFREGEDSDLMLTCPRHGVVWIKAQEVREAAQRPPTRRGGPQVVRAVRVRPV